MKIDTVIFDLDGTLLNTLDDLYVCFNYALSQYGFKNRTLNEIRNFVGNGIKKAIQRALPEDVEDYEIIKIVEVFKNYYMEHLFDNTKPYDGIIELLEYLKKNGYKLALVSNKYDDAVKKMNDKYFREYISVAIGEGYGIEKKPSPLGVYKAIELLDSKLENSVYIGDSEVDIITAKNAGIPCISVLWGFKDKEFLKREGGKFFAKNSKDIIEIIEKKIYLG